MDDYYYFGWKPYVSAASRRRQAARDIARFRKKDAHLSPVIIDGRTIARTFWGKAWCENLERYSDFANRLPRGRTYVRHGAVVDLKIAPGAVTALVSGSEIYNVQVTVTAVPKTRWRGLCTDCAGEIDSLIELLQGRLSQRVMARLCQDKVGLFPSPKEISFTCSCPDWASMCKHVAAVLYGIGARLDTQPDLLFALRQVDQQDLIADGGQSLPSAKKRQAAGRVLDTGDLSAIFGIDIAPVSPVTPREKRKETSVARPPAAAPKPAPVAKAAALATPPVVRKEPKARIGKMSAAKRKAIAKRMKDYWNARRKQASGAKPPVAPAPAVVAKPSAFANATADKATKVHAWSGDRQAVSKRMKEYWAARRKSRG